MSLQGTQEDKKTVTIATVRKWIRWLNQQHSETLDGADGLYIAMKATDLNHFIHHIGQYAGKCDCWNCENPEEEY